MSLTALQRKSLKAKAHHLNPVVTIGSKGLTDAVIKEIDGALTAHELIKAKDYASERSERQALAEYACLKTNAELVSVIGKTLILYRKKKEKK
jgi:RNA-binding protein